jgi:anti-sigma-K factor RskA
VEKIQARIDLSGSTSTARDKVSVLIPKKARFWQGLSMLATAAAVVFAVLLFIPGQMQPQAVQQFTVIQNAENKALWLVEIMQKTIDARASDKVEQLAKNDYELWMLPDNGSAPISLGLLPQSGSVILAKHPLFAQLDISALAVSLEPLGGSPTGAPIEVLYVSELTLL